MRGRCASSSLSCTETAAKGGDPKSMSELPHSCGPERMGLGWKDGLKRQKKSFSYVDWMHGEQEDLKEENVAKVFVGTDVVWTEQKSLGTMKLVTIGDRIVVVKRETFENQEEGRLEAQSFEDFEGEVLTGPRRPKMVEVFQYNTEEPGAGKHTRLVLEDFTKVPPPGQTGLLWCGTSLSAQSIDIVECSRSSRFQVQFCKAFTINSIGATYKPEINAETILMSQFQGEKVLVLELGCNEVSDATENSEMEAMEMIDRKMEALVQLANHVCKREKLQKVILLNRLPCCDTSRKAALSLYSDEAMQNALRAKGSSDIEIRDLVLDCDPELSILQLYSCL